jgi:hypothetical protein
MQSDAHARARFLIDEVRVGGISPEDARWLRGHVAECGPCAAFEETTARIVRGLEEFSFDVPVKQSGRQPAAGRGSAPLWWALAAAALVMLAAVPVYQNVRTARQERADALLLEGVESRVSRSVPRAMEPLAQPQGEVR